MKMTIDSGKIILHTNDKKSLDLAKQAGFLENIVINQYVAVINGFLSWRPFAIACENFVV